MNKILSLISKPFIWIIKNIISFVFRSLLILAVLWVGWYYAMLHFAPEYKDDVDKYINIFKNEWTEVVTEIYNSNIDTLTKIVDKKTPPAQTEVKAYLNDNKDSNIAMVITAWAEENITVFRENNLVNKIVVWTEGWDSYLISVNDLGLPTELSFWANKITYQNYNTENQTVDVITNIDWKITGKKWVKINLNKKTSFFQIIPSTHAAEWDYYIWTVWQVWSIVSCGGGIWLTIVSGWSASPMLYLSCWVFLTRVITSNTEIWPCSWDVLECAKDAVVEVFTHESSGYTHETDEAKDFIWSSEEKPEIILDLIPDENEIVTDWKYSANINESNTSNGINVKNKGTISATFNNWVGTCSILIYTIVSGTPTVPDWTEVPEWISIPSIDMEIKAESTSCNGTVNKKDWSFVFTWIIKTTTDATSPSGTIPSQEEKFTVTWKIEWWRISGQLSTQNNTNPIHF